MTRRLMNLTRVGILLIGATLAYALEGWGQISSTLAYPFKDRAQPGFTLANALDDWGQHCWLFDQHVDIMGISVVKTGGPLDIVMATSVLRAGNFYQMLGKGTLYPTNPSVTPDFAWELILHTGHDSQGFFDGNHSCTFHIYLDTNNNGPWYIECIGAAPLFRREGTLSYRGLVNANGTCQNTEAASQVDRPAIGE